MFRTDKITWANTADDGGGKLVVYNPASYAENAVITVMNAFHGSFDVIRDNAANPAMQFYSSQLGGLVNEFTLDPFQKAILIKTSGDNWDVILTSI